MVYFFVFFLSVFFVNIFGGSRIWKNVKQIKSIYILFFLLLLILIGLRHYSVGPDTYSYVGEFETIDTQGNIKEIILKSPEPLYTSMVWLCRNWTDNYTVFLLLFAVPIAGGFTFLVKRYSDDYLLSMLLFSVLGILGFSMAGIRQATALGITMFGYYFAKEKKWIKFLFSILLAYGFHNSAIICLIIYILVTKINFKALYPYWIAAGISMILGLTRSPLVMKVAKIMMIGERFQGYADGRTSNLNLTMFFIQALLLLMCCILIKFKLVYVNRERRILLANSFVGLCLQAFTPIVGEFFRASMYFSVYQCLLIPNVISGIVDKELKKVIYISILSATLLYIFTIQGTAAMYIPYWK